MKGERQMKTSDRIFRSSLTLTTLFLLAVLLTWGAGPVSAADPWPVKHVELINPFAAGAAADIQARKLAEIISRDLGQPMVVRNVLGAGGAIAYSEVNRAKPDGHTLIWYSGAINTLAARKQIPFDYNAFEPVAGVGIETVSIAVSKNAPWKNFKEFIAHAKQNPGKVTMGNSGMGSVTHMVPVAMASKAGIKITHVPFGTGLAMVALMGGKIDSSSQHPAEVFNQVKAGEVRILAISSEKRINIWPDVPTMKEVGRRPRVRSVAGDRRSEGNPQSGRRQAESAGQEGRGEQGVDRLRLVARFDAPLPCPGGFCEIRRRSRQGDEGNHAGGRAPEIAMVRVFSPPGFREGGILFQCNEFFRYWPMSPRKDIASSLVLILFSVTFLIYTTRYPLDSWESPGPAVFPLVLGVVLLLLPPGS